MAAFSKTSSDKIEYLLAFSFTDLSMVLKWAYLLEF